MASKVSPTLTYAESHFSDHTIQLLSLISPYGCFHPQNSFGAYQSYNIHIVVVFEHLSSLCILAFYTPHLQQLLTLIVHFQTTFLEPGMFIEGSHRCDFDSVPFSMNIKLLVAPVHFVFFFISG